MRSWPTWKLTSAVLVSSAKEQSICLHCGKLFRTFSESGVGGWGVGGNMGTHRMAAANGMEDLERDAHAL
jgi:hypothetical protein